MLDASAHYPLFDDEPDVVVVDLAPDLGVVRAPAAWPDSSRSEEPVHLVILTPDGVETRHRPLVGERDTTACEVRFQDARLSKIDATSSTPICVRFLPEGYGGHMCTRCFLPNELRAGRVADAHAEGDAHPEETYHEMERRRKATLEMPPIVVPRKDPTR